MKYGLVLLMNNKCNNKCKYCYLDNDGDKFITLEKIYSIIDFFNKDKDFNNSIEFFGGEPTISFDIIEKIVSNKYKDINFSIISNGHFFNNDDYLLYLETLKKIGQVTISFELNQLSHSNLRNNNDDYFKILDRIIEFKQRGVNISINSSLNIFLDRNLNELNYVYNILKENKIYIHFYSLKSLYGNFNSPEEFLLFLKNVYRLNKNIYYDIIHLDESDSDFSYLCTYDNNLTIDSDLNVITCQWENKILGNLNYDNLDTIKDNFSQHIIGNNKIFFKGCKDCFINPGNCQISCPAFIKENIGNNIELLEKCCSIQKIIYLLRKGGDNVKFE